MKRYLLSSLSVLLLCLGLSGCGPVGDKNASQSIIYAATAVLALALFVGYCCLSGKKSFWVFLLFSSVLVVNTGYLCLSVSASLEQALMANRLSYLGAVFLPMAMYFIILDTTNTHYREWLPGVLFGVSAFMLFIAGSPGYLEIYYKEVSFRVVNGAGILVKTYGSWHRLYLVFLLGYFAVMVITIIRATVKKTVDTTAHAVVLAAAVLVNIGVWLIEQLIRVDFEMLSVSYIISELFLLGVHLVMRENQRLKELIRDMEMVQHFTPVETTDPETMRMQPDGSVDADWGRIESFFSGLGGLTPTERRIYEAYIARATTKEIMTSMNITQNTLKFHNKNLYSKLGVSSRTELLELYKQANTARQMCAKQNQDKED